MKTVTKSEWFTAVESCTHHWQRKDATHLVLWFSGYKTAEMHAAEAQLKQFGAYALAADFDTLCGKTALIIREPRHLVD